ncbi:HDOD domain-containing protein [Chitinibacter fontanus]|uniref:HDOD domain-containing protein n=1 Tax=Chitinibacter fontanus TaxID=1737446 RepID=A0A7D5VCE1_9NEIS|nr:HDOD domain-containing protein [Chitinibacter fontanus]QLI82773.1 HDOD domain-containing protein [Chitinibacter fontanus]
MLRWLLDQLRFAPSPGEKTGLSAKSTDFATVSQIPEGGLLRRRAIYNRHWGIEAYSLTLRELNHQPHQNIHSYDQVLLCEIERLLNSSDLKTQIWLELSWHNLPLLLAHQFTFKFTVIAHGEVPFSDAELSQLLTQLRIHFHIGATAKRWHLSNPWLGQQLQAIVLNIQSPDFAVLSQQINTCRQIAPNAQLWVNEVDSREAAEACFQLGADFVSGHIFTWAEAQQLSFPDSFLHLNQVLQLTRQNADAKQIAGQLKTDPALSARLLRYVNSAAMALPHPMSNLEQAITVIGNQRLYRWLSLLLFSCKGHETLDQTLLETALTRARLMETAAAPHFSPADCELLFLTGLFSLLDYLLRVPRSVLLKELNPPRLVIDTLCGQTTAFSPYLQLAEHSELYWPEARLLESCQLSTAEFNRLQIAATLWALSTLAS